MDAVVGHGEHGTQGLVPESLVDVGPYALRGVIAVDQHEPEFLPPFLDPIKGGSRIWRESPAEYRRPWPWAENRFSPPEAEPRRL
jgi:hypothetical protein